MSDDPNAVHRALLQVRKRGGADALVYVEVFLAALGSDACLTWGDEWMPADVARQAAQDMRESAKRKEERP